MIKAEIKDIAYFLPEETLTNTDLSTIYPEYTPKEIFRRTGIETRYVRKPGETASDLGIEAGKNLLTKHPELKDQLDCLFYCASGQDYVGPSTASVVHRALELSKKTGTFDVHMGCSGFTNGLALCTAMIASGQARNIMFITADIPTSVIHPEDFYLRALFSDAASATWIKSSQDSKIGISCYGADGSGVDNLIVYGSGSKDPLDKQWVLKYDDVGGLLNGRMEMNGEEILAFSLREVPPLVDRILEKNKMSIDEIDKFVFHHASGIILKFLARKMRLPYEKVYSVIEEVGNTVSVSIPLALAMGIERGEIKKGEKVLICGFGIGYSWSGTIIEI